MGLSSLKIATKLWVFIVFVILAIASVATFGLVRGASIVGEGRATQMAAMDMVQVTTRWTGLNEANAVRNQALILSGDAAISSAF